MTITHKKLLLSYVRTGNNVSVNVIVKSQGLESNLLEGKIQPFAVDWPPDTSENGQDNELRSVQSEGGPGDGQRAISGGT